MDVVDAQYHMFHQMDLERSVAAMNAVGIRSAVIDEFWYYVDGAPHPCDLLQAGVYRPTASGAQRAAALYPDRFCYLLRVNHNDSDVRTVVKLASANPNLRALRCDASTKGEIKKFAEGGYSEIFLAAADAGLPIFVLTYDNAALIERYLQEYPSVAVIIDHCGFMSHAEKFDSILQLAKFPNAHLKWAHARMIFGRGSYPYSHLSVPLRKAIDSFGAERIMWSADSTMATTGECWAEMLYYLRDGSLGLSNEEQEWILGRSARKALNWPAKKFVSPRAAEFEEIERNYRRGPAD